MENIKPPQDREVLHRLHERPKKYLEFGPLTFPDYQAPIRPLGTRVVALDIVISPERAVSPDLIRDLLPGPHVYGSRVFGEEISIVTSFTPDDRLRERYLIFSDSPKALLRHLAKVIDGIVTIENYYHLLLLPFPEFTKAVDRIHELEQHHLEQRGRITEKLGASESKTLQEWLSRLMIDFMEVSRFAESMRYRLSASVPYNAIIEATVRGFQERPLAPFRPISDYVLGGISGVAAGYQQLMVRIEAIESDFQSIISVIRTQVNLMQQEQNLVLEDQNLRLLARVDKTTKSQAMLQHTVEGLSVIVIAYYLSGLAGYLFKAFEKWGWIKDAVTASGLFVPISLVLSLTLMLLGRAVIRKRMSSNED